MLDSRLSHVKLLVITGDPDVVFAALEEYSGKFSDNGGDPDGLLWLTPAGDIPEDVLAAAVATGAAEIRSGSKVPGYRGRWNTQNGEFCGYDGDAAYTLDLGVADGILSDIEIGEYTDADQERNA